MARPHKSKLHERIGALIAKSPANGTALPAARDPLDALRVAMGELRRALRRGAASPGDTTAEKLNRRRFARNKVQERFKRLRRKPAGSLPKPLLIAKYRPSPILDGLLPDRARRWIRILDRRPVTPPEEVRLEGFSFFENPDTTFEGLKRIAELEASEVVAHVHFQDDFCIDIGPYLVLAEAWPAMAPVFGSGRMMPPLQKVIRAVGLHRQFGMTLRAATDEKDIWAYPLQRRRPANSSSSDNLQLEPQRRERVADGLCNAIDSWLDQPKIRQELTLEGRAWIANIVGELLDNAERHSHAPDKDGDWSIAAFMARRTEAGEDVFRCYLGFLSVGSSIAESLQTAAPRVKTDLGRYCAKHSDSGITRETLSTLFALQDGITRDPLADAADRGGYGLQEVLEMVSILGHSTKPGREPRVTIISGTSCIRLRPPYVKGERMGGADSPRVLWCNAENSSNCRPDAEFVYDLRERLAGTVISVAFTLDPDYYDSVSDANGSDHEGN